MSLRRSLPPVFVILCSAAAVVALVWVYVHHASPATFKDEGLQRFDFGSAWVLSEITHEFTLGNDSDKDLVIDRIEASCGCIVAQNPPVSIPARGRVRLSVKAEITSAVGNDRFSAQVVVILQNASPRIMQIVGNIIFDAPAGFVNLGALSTDRENAPANFELRAIGDAVALQVEQAVFDRKVLDVNWTPRDGAPSILDVHVTVNASSLGPGDFDSSIQFVTNDPKKAPRVVYLRGRVMSLLEAEPRELNFGLLKPSEPRDLWIKLYSPVGNPVVIDSIDVSTPESFEVIAQRPENGAVWMNVQMKSAFEHRAISHGKIRVAAHVGIAWPERSLGRVINRFRYLQMDGRRGAQRIVKSGVSPNDESDTYHSVTAILRWPAPRLAACSGIALHQGGPSESQSSPRIPRQHLCLPDGRPDAGARSGGVAAMDGAFDRCLSGDRYSNGRCDDSFRVTFGRVRMVAVAWNSDGTFDRLWLLWIVAGRSPGGGIRHAPPRRHHVPRFNGRRGIEPVDERACNAVGFIAASSSPAAWDGCHFIVFLRKGGKYA